MPFIAVICRGNLVIPITNGGDGPDAECMATWPTRAEAYEGAGSALMAQAYPVFIIDMDDAT
jgi:hypothetical protein